jgi:hypothetical protein
LPALHRADHALLELALGVDIAAGGFAGSAVCTGCEDVARRSAALPERTVARPPRCRFRLDRAPASTARESARRRPWFAAGSGRGAEHAAQASASRVLVRNNM